MRDDQDSCVMRLFTAQEQRLPADDFVPQFIRRLDREQRNRRIYIALAVVVGVVLTAWVAPWITQTLSIMIDLTSVGVDAVVAVLQWPLAWLVAAALLLALMPILYLWRTSRW